MKDILVFASGCPCLVIRHHGVLQGYSALGDCGLISLLVHLVSPTGFGRSSSPEVMVPWVSALPAVPVASSHLAESLAAQDLMVPPCVVRGIQ